MRKTLMGNLTGHDIVVGLLACVAGGVVVDVLSTAGWLGTRLPFAAIAVVAAIIGITAGVLAGRRRSATDDFKLKRSS